MLILSFFTGLFVPEGLPGRGLARPMLPLAGRPQAPRRRRQVNSNFKNK